MIKTRIFKENLSPTAVLAFIVSVVLCFLLISVSIVNLANVERLTMEQLITNKTSKISEVISRLLYKSEVLSAMIKQHGGMISDFEKIAPTIADDPSILNILLAPDGIVQEVYPLEGNEAVVGLDYFGEGAGNREAIIAKETGSLVLGGPFDSVQGFKVLVGRLPVYISESDGKENFWGLVSVTLKYPEALEAVQLDQLQMQGFAYELWRINPDTNQKQVIADSGYSYNKNTRYIEESFSIVNAEWHLRILPVRAWYEFRETWVLAFISLLVSILVSVIVQNNHNLNILNEKMQVLAHTDSLTGISNRRFFFEAVKRRADVAAKEGKESFIIIFDLDYFKKVNDYYGHRAGDEVLKEVAMRTLKSLRSYDLFARYGGEEFIVFLSDVNKEAVYGIVERIRMNLCDEPIYFENTQISFAASFGIAQLTPVNDIETAASMADNALYKAKSQGRNRTVFSEQAEQ